MNNCRNLRVQQSANLNRTVLNGSLHGSSKGSESGLNITVLGNSRSQPYTPALYSKEKRDEIKLKYLNNQVTQAFLKALIFSKQIEKHETITADQLSIFMDKATCLNVEELELQQKLDMLKSQKELNKKIKCLQLHVAASKKILNSQIEQQVVSLLNVLESASHTLYLRNIDALTDQSQLDVLQELILSSSEKIHQLIKNAGSVDGLKELKDGILELKEKQEMVRNYCKQFEETDHVIGTTTLESLSATLAA